MKNGCKEIATEMGKAITFMAKYDYSLAGSSSATSTTPCGAPMARRRCS